MSDNFDIESLDNQSTIQVEDQGLGSFGKVMLQSINKCIPQTLRENKSIKVELLNFIKNIEDQIDKGKLLGEEWYKGHRLETHRRIRKIILLNIWDNERFLREVLPNSNEDKLTELLFETMLEHAVNKKLT